jgi:protein-disulfide isomerase
MRTSIVIPFVFALVSGVSSSSCTRDVANDAVPAGVPEVAPGQVAPAAAPAAPSPDPIYRVPVEGLPTLGAPDAPVTMVAFTDYQCPYCRRVEATVGELRARYAGALRVVVVEEPLPMHDRARPAALAALAADRQGHFEGMRARLFAAGAGALDDAAIEKAAADEGLALARFDADRGGAAIAALERAQQVSSKLGVTGTPTFFINGRRIVGAQPVAAFEAIIDERLVAARALLAGGTAARDVYARTVGQGLDRVPDDADDHGACKGDGACKGGHDDAQVGAEVEAVAVDGSPARGSASAPITVVEFADYECPFCAKAEATVHALEAAHPGRVRVVFENLPLAMHAHARLAARAALAADAQGRFWEMHDALFARQGALDAAAIEASARDVGLDVARFDRDLADPATEARLAADEARASSLHVGGTPTFFVNGHRLTGAQPIDVFESAARLR